MVQFILRSYLRGGWSVGKYLLISLLIGLLILVHEFGHLLAARLAGISVERFSVGLGPRLWGYRRRDTEYCLSLIPFGGYVLLRATEPEDLFRIPVHKRVCFLLGGPIANFLAAIPCLALVNALSQGAGLKAVFIQPWLQVGQLCGQILAVFARVDPQQLSGLVGMVALGGSQWAASGVQLLLFAAVLSINLGVFNLFPLPILDGGQVLLSLAEYLTPRVQKIRLPLAAAGWLLIIVMLVYTTILDIGRLLA